VKFSEITSAGAQVFGARMPKIESLDESGESQQIISEIKTGDPVIRTKRLSLSKQEIIEVQIVLQKLGYYTGSADGTMNSETMNAIEKFKDENGALRKLF
jgi:peptidoglycan hydrolase-like protein with peptidoglycan-binding domain